MPAPKRESGEEEREDGVERGRETTVLTAGIEACEEKSSGSKPRSYPISEEKKYSGSDDGTKKRDETHRGGSLLQRESNFFRHFSVLRNCDCGIFD